ncbi:hypothetical protein [Methanobrevibacter thaueri]|uniref:hypothetical protein n=1 Tax=Methanobrevibacter thaueri TaxID=190975 RepID=UPI0026EF903C|nr:hypothetical protein [Methanobrevibacter thaueri]
MKNCTMNNTKRIRNPNLANFWFSALRLMNSKAAIMTNNRKLTKRKVNTKSM